MTQNSSPDLSENSEQNKQQASLPLWRQLRWRLMAYFVFFAVLPVLITIYIGFPQLEEQARQQASNQLLSVMELKRNAIIRWLNDGEIIMDILIVDTKRYNQLVSSVANTSTDETLWRQDPLNAELEDFVQAQPTFEEFFIYNKAGDIVASSDPIQIGKKVTGTPYFEAGLINNITQPPYYEVGKNSLTMMIVRPLFDTNNESVGAFAGRLNIDALGEIMLERAGLGDSGETYLVSLENNYLVTPSRFADQGYPLTRAYRSEGIDRALAGENGADTYKNYQENPEVTVIGTYQWLPELSVGMLAEVSESEILGNFLFLQNLIISIAVGMALLAAFLGVFIATRISNPVTTLTQAAYYIARGDLDQRVDISEETEVGRLAEAFNNMSGQLRQTLEGRISDRIRDMQILAKVSGRLSAVLDRDSLMVEVVNQIQDNFNYYHTHIYLIDESGENLLMAEGAGEAGIKMKAEKHYIPKNAPTSLVARAARTGQIVQVDNVYEDENWLPNPLLPDTHSEMAVPILLEGKAVGVLDVQDRKIAGLGEADASLLRSLSDHIAVAIRNARLFKEVESALFKANSLHQKYVERSWDKSRVQLDHTRLEYGQFNPVDLPEAIIVQSRELAKTQSRSTFVTISSDETDSTHNRSAQQTIAAPLNVMGQSIGTLQLHKINNKVDSSTWTEDELTMLDAILDQVAQTAENLRLFDETRERASREATIRDITDKLRAAPNLEQLIKIASQELGQNLSATHVKFELGLNEDKSTPRNDNGQTHSAEGDSL